MESALVCQICGQKLSFNPGCPCSLGEHMLRKHPHLEMGHFSNQDICNCCSVSSKNRPLCSRTQLPCLCSSFEKPRKPKPTVFKTTVESWKPGPLRVTCPRCQHLDRPCIRHQRNRISRSALGALCLLLCWPVCFMSESSRIHLFCRRCHAFMGEYDRKTGRMKCPPCPASSRYDLNTIPSVC
ncbi:uncharacterized protein LOC143203915 [Rhynchophorus ferrugineus]|uniref:LITAF domain-containing protein n=1 Tax=Rhynchophorus ferrugineus TaxID=354439 RepID=A0A834HSG0_RHYFE|nr:hypothetical protein GWI33_019083 [Rhynchophorus ferrugineus]